MKYLQGKTVFGGVVSGTAYVFNKRTEQKINNQPLPVAQEKERLDCAVSDVKKEIKNSIEFADNKTVKDVLEIHLMMLEDDDILDFLHNAVNNEGTSAEKAVKETEQYFTQMFLDTHDEYMIARTDDIRDVCSRLTAHLSSERFSDKPDSPVVLVAEELLASDLIGIDRKNLIGIITGSGSLNSHISILIREMGIPAVICKNANEITNDISLLLDADNGVLFIEPDDEIIKNYSGKMNKNSSLFVRENLPCKLYMNVGNPKELNEKMLESCDGIGLFRTEYLYFGRKDLPGEEEQFEVYKNILKKANGKPVVIRTFDLGSDKLSEAIPLKKEENPALGVRGLRVYSVYPDAFKTQLRALLRAAAYGDLRIMYPMVTSCREIEQIKNAVSLAATELSESGTEYSVPKQGAMIETPAAALLSDKIAKTVDFLSIGTNDLIQYTTAVDRQNGALDDFFDPECEAVISLIKMTAENAHKNGIEVGICGEMASMPEFIDKWKETGVDYISVSNVQTNS